MKGFKGFNPDFTCKGKQYSENTVFEEEKAEICNSGMHFCEYPLDVFKFYPPVNDNCELNEFAEVEALDGAKTKDNIKYCTKKLKVGTKIGIPGLIQASVDYIVEKAGKEKINTNTGYCSASTNTGYCSASTNTGYCSASTNTGDCSASTNTGNYSASTNTGYCSASTNTGDYSASTNTGDYSASIVEGKDSVAIAFGVDSKAKGALGCYIALAEWKHTNNGFVLKDFKSAKVDGKKIKENTFYKLVNSKFKEVEE